MSRRIRLPIACGALPLLAACATSADLTPQQEYYAGRALAANSLHEYKRVLQNPELERYVYLVGTFLAMNSDRAETYRGPMKSYRFTILDTDEVNAFAAPSGFVFVTKGLVKQCQDEDELAAVIAHEIGHVVLRHPEDAAATAKRHADAQEAVSFIGSVLSAIGKASDDKEMQKFGQQVVDFSKAMDEISGIVLKGYDRKQEYAADAEGLRLLARVGYDPQSMKRMLQRLGPRKSGVLGWVGDTHPAPAERVGEIDRFLAERRAEGKPLRGHVEEARTARFHKAVSGLN